MKIELINCSTIFSVCVCVCVYVHIIIELNLDTNICLEPIYQKHRNRGESEKNGNGKCVPMSIHVDVYHPLNC